MKAGRRYAELEPRVGRGAGGAEAGYRGSGEEEDAGMVAVEAAFA